MPINANQFILLEHRDEQKRAGVGELGNGFVWVFHRNVGNVDYLLRADDSIKAGASLLQIDGASLLNSANFCGALWSATRQERSPVTEQHRAERGLTNAGCVCQHRLENPIELSGRRANNAQHLVARGLPFQRFAQLALRLREAAFEIANGILRHRAVQPFGARRRKG